VLLGFLVSHPGREDKDATRVGHAATYDEEQKQVSFDFAQGRLSTPFPFAMLRAQSLLMNEFRLGFVVSHRSRKRREMEGAR
jgi:hypothetical protein